MSSILGEDLDSRVRELMKLHHISPEVGFLTKNPPRYLPKNSRNYERDEYFAEIDALLFKLPQLIRAKGIAANVRRLRIPPGNFKDLSWEMKNAFHLKISMLTHAYWREILPYKNAGEHMRDTQIRALLPQLAVPLWRISEETGAAPSMSYFFYSPSNYYLKDPALPINLSNLELIHSFTGMSDEKWFVNIHQVIQHVYAPAIPELLKAMFLSELPHESVVKEAITRCLLNAAVAAERWVDVLYAMPAHCDYRRYFDEVRLFYLFPRRVLFEEVNGSEGKLVEDVLGETGGQTQDQHFRLAALGIYPHQDVYFPLMRKHMPKTHRDLIETAFNSRLRKYILEEGRLGNREIVAAYNKNIYSLIDSRKLHKRWVDLYITRFGESHGTGKPPLDWLDKHIKRARRALIPLPEINTPAV